MAQQTEQETPLSSTKSIGFRPGALRNKIDLLYTDLLKNDAGLKLSDIMRDGFVAFWPQIEAYLRARQMSNVNAEELTSLVMACAKASEYNVSPAELSEAIMQVIERKQGEVPVEIPA